MKLQEVLINIDKLFDSWGIYNSDWILVSQYAYRLLGYKVKFRKGHFNILIRKNKIPWKIKEGIEIYPPRGTRYRKSFDDFIKKTGFDFDINLATEQEFKQKKGKFVNFALTNKRTIKVQKPIGAVREFEKLLSFSTREGLGTDRLDKDIRYIKDMITVLTAKNEQSTATAFKKLLQKYLQAKKQRKIIKKDYNDKLVGIAASGGRCRGVVCVVKSSKDIKNCREKNILVVSNTSPTLFFRLPRVSAIITDHGGMLSHAAILAREMNIPCVVGTLNATNILKNGDVVNVDAQRGIVEKLK